MTYLERGILALILAALAGCATESASVKLSTNTARASRANAREMQLLDLRLKLGDLQNAVAVKDAQIAELTELLVAAELARTDHLVGRAGASAGSDR